MQSSTFKTPFLQLSPNPADGTIRLNYKVPDDSRQVVLEIIAYTGELIASYSLPEKGTSYILRTATIANGFYFVRLRSNQGIHQITKLIIQH